jgi:hypothetical protein
MGEELIVGGRLIEHCNRGGPSKIGCNPLRFTAAHYLFRSPDCLYPGIDRFPSVPMIGYLTA